MSYARSAAHFIYGKGNFIKKLFCLHHANGWVQLPIEDWRTDEGYWQCKRCGKIKNFGFRKEPIQYERN